MSIMHDCRLRSLHSLQSSGVGGRLVVLMVVLLMRIHIATRNTRTQRVG